MNEIKTLKVWIMIAWMIGGILFVTTGSTVYAKPVLPSAKTYTARTGGRDGERFIELGTVKGLTTSSVAHITVEERDGVQDVIGLEYRMGDDENIRIVDSLTISYNEELHDLNDKTGTWELEDVYIVGNKQGKAAVRMEVDGETVVYEVTVKHTNPGISLIDGMSKEDIKKEKGYNTKWKKGKNARYLRTVINEIDAMQLNISSASKYTSIVVSCDKPGLKIAKEEEYNTKLKYASLKNNKYKISDLGEDYIYTGEVSFRIGASKSGIYKLKVKTIQDGKTVAKTYYINAVKYSNPLKSLKFGNAKQNYAPYFKNRRRVTDLYMKKKDVKASLGQSMTIQTNKNFTITDVYYRKYGEWISALDDLGTKLNIYKTGANTWKTDKLPKDFWELHIYYQYKYKGKVKTECVEIYYDEHIFIK